MTTDRIIMIASIVMTVAAFAWGLYQQVKGNSAAAASAFIAEIEKSGLLGPEKMAYVVSQLYELIPAPFKSILTKTVLETLAQKIFDYMRKYANAYAEAKSGKGKEAYKPVTDELASDLAKQLAALGPVAMRSFALNFNIQVEGKTDAEILSELLRVISAKDPVPKE